MEFRWYELLLVAVLFMMIGGLIGYTVVKMETAHNLKTGIETCEEAGGIATLYVEGEANEIKWRCADSEWGGETT